MPTFRELQEGCLDLQGLTSNVLESNTCAGEYILNKVIQELLRLASTHKSACEILANSSWLKIWDEALTYALWEPRQFSHSTNA